MKDAVVFNGLNSLDFHDIRRNVIRIPEVSIRIREAQKIWDRGRPASFDFYNFIASDDQLFLSNIKLKSLAAAVVQVGLYDRYLKNFKKPRYVIGNVNGDSALKVVTGQMSFAEMVIESSALSESADEAPAISGGQPVLSGISLTEYGVYEMKLAAELEEASEYESVEADTMDIDKILTMMVEDFEAKKFVNVGPGNLLIDKSRNGMALRDIQILESIDLDPMLSWFWPSLKPEPILSAVGAQ